MIALCQEHATKADNGAFADDQLRQFKRDALSRADQVSGRFDWMRQDLLAVIGGNYYYDVSVIFQLNEVRCIWFDRDEDRNLLLNFRMPTLSGEPRARIDQNWWTVPPSVEELICPPGGRTLEVRYQNGDRFRAEFLNVESEADMIARYSNFAGFADGSIPFPLTVVEVWERAAGTIFEFGPTYSRIAGSFITGGLMTGIGRGAIRIDVDESVLARLSLPITEETDED
jgi:hypothetical protein